MWSSSLLHISVVHKLAAIATAYLTMVIMTPSTLYPTMMGMELLKAWIITIFYNELSQTKTTSVWIILIVVGKNVLLHGPASPPYRMEETISFVLLLSLFLCSRSFLRLSHLSLIHFWCSTIWNTTLSLNMQLETCNSHSSQTISPTDRVLILLAIMLDQIWIFV